MKILYNTGEEFKESKESANSIVVELQDNHGNIEKKTVQELVSDNVRAISRLIGSEDPDDTERSIRTIARLELAKQLVPENAEESLNTLQEIATWIQSNPESAAQINQRITNLETAVPFTLYVQNGVYGYKNANNEFVAFKSQADIDAAVSAASAVGTATAADVLVGKTFSNAEDKGIEGSIPIRDDLTQVSSSGINDSTGKPYVTFPYGYWPERGILQGDSYANMTDAQAVAACPSQEKTVTAGISAISVTPDTNKLLSMVTVNPTPSEEKSTTAGTSATSVTPSSGKLMSKVTISPTPSEEKSVTAGTSNTSVTPSSGKLMSKVTVSPTPSQSKSTTSSRSAQTISPDSGKLLSSVSIAKYPDASGNYTCGSNTGAASSNDMGATNNYRYVNATAVYNKGKADLCESVKSNSETYATSASKYSVANNSLYIFYWPSGGALAITSGGTIKASGQIKDSSNAIIASWCIVLTTSTSLVLKSAETLRKMFRLCGY